MDIENTQRSLPRRGANTVLCGSGGPKYDLRYLVGFSKNSTLSRFGRRISGTPCVAISVSGTHSQLSSFLSNCTRYEAFISLCARIIPRCIIRPHLLNAVTVVPMFGLANTLNRNSFALIDSAPWVCIALTLLRYCCN